MTEKCFAILTLLALIISIFGIVINSSLVAGISLLFALLFYVFFLLFTILD